jgi:hypothetical protein
MERRLRPTENNLIQVEQKGTASHCAFMAISGRLLAEAANQTRDSTVSEHGEHIVALSNGMPSRNCISEHRVQSFLYASSTGD